MNGPLRTVIDVRYNHLIAGFWVNVKSVPAKGFMIYSQLSRARGHFIRKTGSCN